MAEGLVIKIGADINDAISGLSRLQQQVAVFGGGVTKYVGNAEESFKKLKNSLNNLPNVTGQATAALTNFGRVVQDAPFGIIGIANNIDPLVQSFNKLRESTGSTSGAFKALIGQLKGPAGIALGISAVTSLLITYGDRLFGASAGAKELAAQTKAAADAQKQIITQLGQERAEVDKLIILINSENTTREEKETILKKLQQISPQYFGDLKTEAGLITNLSAAYQKYLQSLVARSEVAVLTKQLEDISVAIVDLERQGATTEVIDLGLQRGLNGRLNTTKLLTKEQVAQLTLNTQLTAEERKRQAVLNQIAEKQGALADDLKIRAKDIKVEPQDKLDFSQFLQIQEIELPVKFSDDPQFYSNSISPVGALINKEITDYFKKNPIDDPSLLKEYLKFLGDKNTFKFDFLGFKGLDQAQKDLAETGQMIANMLTPSLDAMIQAIGRGENAFKAFGEGVKAVLLQVIQKLVATTVLAGVLAALFPSGIGGSKGFSQIFGSLLGFRANGGPVSGNSPYIVGERGPELFVPSVSGGIVPNNSVGSFMGGGMSSSGGRGSVLRGQDIILAYARTQRSQLRVNG